MKQRQARALPAPKTPLSAVYVPASRLLDFLQSSRPVLGMVAYAEPPAIPMDVEFPLVVVNLPILGPEPLVEVWTSPAPIFCGREHGIAYSRNNLVLFGAVEIKQSDQIWLDRDTHQAISRTLGFIKNQGYPHLLRIWNYFPGINAKDNEIDRYQLFCLGRHQAFFEHGSLSTHELPAASALGTATGSLWIYFLASKAPATQRENPRQTSAYRYPRQYGPHSPSFARATLARWETENHLYISGTASIVGHLSLHPGDVQQQMAETLANINALIEHTAREEDINMNPGNIALLKVYIRQARHFPLIRKMLESSLGTGLSVLYLQADICRRDLLLEIEGVCIAPVG
ncbi:MAG TPA: hypothetical protein VHE58_04820 [Burkholderiales bacterium]|nr:hypothetical protein [Burkholderiales bacterium]